MNIDSVQLYSVRGKFADDPGRTLDRLAAIGFKQVEPYGVMENLGALTAGLPASGLTAPTAHSHFLGSDQNALFAAAAALGIGVVIDPMVPAQRWNETDDITEIANQLNSAAVVAATHDVRVGYHNHWWELESMIDGRHALEVLAERLDPAVVLEVDTYWATAGGADAAALLTRLGDRVVAIHVKDGGLAVDGSGQVPAGQGQMPIANVLAAAPDALPVVEFDRYDEDIFAGLAASHTYLIGRPS